MPLMFFHKNIKVSYNMCKMQTSNLLTTTLKLYYSKTNYHKHFKLGMFMFLVFLYKNIKFLMRVCPYKMQTSNLHTSFKSIISRKLIKIEKQRINFK